MLDVSFVQAMIDRVVDCAVVPTPRSLPVISTTRHLLYKHVRVEYSKFCHIARISIDIAEVACQGTDEQE